MKLTYIWHDCFWLQSDSANVVFDFWKDPTSPSPSEIPAFLKEADKDKPLYVFVSHHHKDHYSKRIFEWHSLFSDIRYIISDDTARHARHILNPGSLYSGPKPSPSAVTVLKPGESFSDRLITIHAFASTDIGNSYAVSLDGMTYFHAGDLNAWIWKDSSTSSGVEESLSDFGKILDSILMKYQSFDFVMFPVDSRIGRDYFTGAKLFVRVFDVRHFFPMHFELGEDAHQIRKFHLDAAKTELYMNPHDGEYICLQMPYSSFSRG